MSPAHPVRLIALSAVAVAAATTVIVTAMPAGASGNAFSVKARVTDATGAPTVDPDLVNPWGMSQSPNSPVWVSDNHSGKSTLYTASASPKVALTVTIPGGDPTGQVYNGTSHFSVAGAPATFIFDSEAGTITGWNSGTHAVRKAAVKGAIFKGLALTSVKGKPRLLATDFHHGKVDVFSGSWSRLHPTGAFVDKKLPAGYAPFGIAALNGNVLVSYAKQDAAAEDDSPGAGHGYVDVYTPAGAMVKRLISRGSLDSPWGMVIAPKGFGPFGGDLLVGNFGDGRINAYNATTGAKQATMHRPNGKDVVLPGLWGLLFGNGTSAPKHALMFTSGPGGEAHGRWGTITAG